MLFFVTANVFCQEQEQEQSEDTFYIQQQENQPDSEDKTTEENTADVKIRLSKIRYISPWIGFFFNIAPSLGIGSFIQGDTKSGFIGLATELGGATIMAVGLLWRNSLEFDLNAPAHIIATTVTVTGFLLAAGSIFFQLIAPFTFYENQKKFNLYKPGKSKITPELSYTGRKLSISIKILAA
ncbi:MAG: hypothetical protein Ta2F_14180 [Termitinemataceae bacterium]|nr:MAG: hypothetical protein Ta2F_14180 [Termitinemataceae bacterium]